MGLQIIGALITGIRVRKNSQNDFGKTMGINPPSNQHSIEGTSLFHLQVAKEQEISLQPPATRTPRSGFPLPIYHLKGLPGL